MPYFVFLSLNPEKSVTLALVWATDALCLPFIVGENEIPVTAHPNFRHEDESSLWLTVLHPDGRKDPGLTAIFWACKAISPPRQMRKNFSTTDLRRVREAEASSPFLDRSGPQTTNSYNPTAGL